MPKCKLVLSKFLIIRPLVVSKDNLVLELALFSVKFSVPAILVLPVIDNALPVPDCVIVTASELEFTEIVCVLLQVLIAFNTGMVLPDVPIERPFNN